MHFTSEQRLENGVVERNFTIGDVSGILWTPSSLPAPIILMGHPGGLQAMHPRLSARALRSAADGFAAAAIELPGGGDRPRLARLDQARAELRGALANGQPLEGIVDRLVLPLVELAVPEVQAVLDVLLVLDELSGPVGYSGGPVAIGIRLAHLDPRIAAVGLFAGNFVPPAILDEARRVTIPAHVLLQWDDEDNNRQQALDLFDALGSREKTLQANLGGHRGVPPFAGDDAARFFARHLGRKSTGQTSIGPDS